MLKRLVVGALLLTVIAAEVSSRSLGPGSGLRALTNAELQRMLPGAYFQEVRPANGPNLSSDEQFNLDGSHLLYAESGDVAGEYMIKNDEICVKNELNKRYCRVLAVDKAGRHYVGLPSNLLPVSIRRLSDFASIPRVRTQ